MYKEDNNTTEVDYTSAEELFAIEIECKFCGENKTIVLFDDINKMLILKCNNENCGLEDVINLC